MSPFKEQQHYYCYVLKQSDLKSRYFTNGIGEFYDNSQVYNEVDQLNGLVNVDNVYFRTKKRTPSFGTVLFCCEINNRIVEIYRAFKGAHAHYVDYILSPKSSRTSKLNSYWNFDDQGCRKMYGIDNKFYSNYYSRKNKSMVLCTTEPNLDRGHLFPKGQANSPIEQLLSQQYYNIVPQFKDFNRDAWKQVEAIIQNKYNQDARIRTGSSGYRPRFFLNKRQRLIPIPAFIWTLLVDEEVAFIGANTQWNSKFCKAHKRLRYVEDLTFSYNRHNFFSENLQQVLFEWRNHDSHYHDIIKCVLFEDLDLIIHSSCLDNL